MKNTSGIISQVQSLGSSVGGYVSSELPQLNTIETMLTNKQPLDKIKAAVKSLHDETGSLNSSTKLELSSIRETTHTMDGYFTQLVALDRTSN